MKIIVDDKIPFIRGQVERLADEVVYLPGSDIAPADVRDADILLIRTRTQCDRRLLEGSRVRFIVTATIGYDHLDTDYLREAGIEWTNCPGCNATSVAQYVRNSLLTLERQGMVSLQEATLGIIGYGHVGKAVYQAMRPYVKEIQVNDPPLVDACRDATCDVRDEAHNDANMRMRHAVSLQEVAACDIITLHTPLTFDGPYPTHHLVGEPFLQQLTRRPILINAARGGVVDEAALLKALDAGLVRAAVIDTWEGEPDISRALLERAAIATPHIAGYSADGKANATRMTLEAVARWMGRKEEFDIRPPQAAPNRTALNYNPTDDSLPLKLHPEGFEQQRGNYPLRREA
ncbi:MAG: 4-phosphoerythronate dehydrogenase [Bacteroidaceae bacterium]|nr:4-phosphoerythronate dehydrogenase [Bacteroidaceae bacterium]